MPDFGAPVATSVNTGGGLDMVSKLLGLKQQQQQLQLGAAQVQQQQQTAAQRAAIAGIDWSKYDDGTGTVSTDKMLQDKDLQQRSGDQFPQILQAGAQIRGQQTENKQKLAQLNGALLGQFSQSMGALATDPDVRADNPTGRQKYKDTMAAFGKLSPEAQNIANIYGKLADVAPKGQLLRGVQAIQLQGMDAATQAGRQVPSLVDTGPGFQNVNPLASPLSIPRDLGPEARAERIDLGNGQTAILNRATKEYTILGKPLAGGGGAAGGAQPAAGGVRTSADDAPPPNAPGYVQKQFADSAAEARQHVLKTREQDHGYGDSMAVAANIRKLSQTVSTGPGSQFWHDTWARVGPIASLGNAGDISNYQQLGAWLDRQATGLRSQMGLPATNEGLATAQVIGGNTEYNRGAIQAKNSYNEALAQGLHAYRQGLDRVEGFTGNPSPSAVNAYRSAWTDNFDPRAYEWKLAMQRGDTAGAAAITKGMAPAQLNELKRKGKALDRLSQGQLP